jgi:N,N'-diacetyllegionaminate synthase
MGLNVVEVVPEIGANHGGDVGTAHTMVEALSAAGAECVKFQIYSAEELVADTDRIGTWGPPGGGTEEAIGSMFDRLSLPWGALDELFAHVRELGMEPFATPFSVRGLDKLLALKVNRLKIASSDVGHRSFLREAAMTGLPIILSLGKATLADADLAVAALEDGGATDVTLLHCVAAYPAPINEANLLVLNTLRSAFPQCAIGYSDHTQGYVAAIVAVALGATMVERHVTLDPLRSGPDEWFSLPISEFASFKQSLEQAAASLGSSRKSVTPCELKGRVNGTRSIFAVRDLPTGWVLAEDDLKVVRPGVGLAPEHMTAVIGLPLKRSVAKNTPLDWQMFKD